MRHHRAKGWNVLFGILVDPGKLKTNAWMILSNSGKNTCRTRSGEKKSLFTDIVHKYYGESIGTTISALSILDCLRN